MSSFAIIVPCYNEARRFQPDAFATFGSQHPDIHFYFIDDGSTDDTANVLAQTKTALPSSTVHSLRKNSGKGEAVRTGLQLAAGNNHGIIGYLDADLSTSLPEFYRLKEIFTSAGAPVLIGSRIKKADTRIVRSSFRHLVGRGLATVIDRRFDLGIYDSQCGAKLFDPAILNGVLEEPFLTRWFFDVELLLRLKKRNPNLQILESPLNEWRNMGDSKLGILSFPSVLKELMVLLNKYQ